MGGLEVRLGEGRILLQELLATIPDYDVLEDEVERPPSEFQLGYTSLPVRFDPTETPS